MVYDDCPQQALVKYCEYSTQPETEESTRQMNEAGNWIYHKYKNLVYKNSMKFSKHLHDVDDSAASCWDRILRQIRSGKYNPDLSCPTTWINTVSMRHLLNKKAAIIAKSKHKVAIKQKFYEKTDAGDVSNLSVVQLHRHLTDKFPDKKFIIDKMIVDGMSSELTYSLYSHHDWFSREDFDELISEMVFSMSVTKRQVTTESRIESISKARFSLKDSFDESDFETVEW